MNEKISRRVYLRSAGAMVAGLTIGARGWASARLDGPLIIGSGEHRYECIHDWLTPPPNILFGDTQGVAQDSRGRIYVSHTVHPDSKSEDAIAVFDEKGKFLTSWGSRFKGGGHGIDLRKEKGTEFLYHCDTAHRQVVKTTLDGTVVWEKGLPTESGKYGEKDAFVPTNVAFAPNGDFYIGDGYGSSWVHQYNIAGEYIRSFGGRGSDPGKFDIPHGLWIDPRGKEPLLAVADRGNRRIQYMTMDGKHVKFVTEGMRAPCNVDFRRGVMLVPDLNSVVTLLDEKNNVVASLGDGQPSNLRGAPRSQFIPGKFIHPHDAMFLRNGDILVAEWVPIGRITLLRRLRG
jgi:hypothetical protein